MIFRLQLQIYTVYMCVFPMSGSAASISVSKSLGHDLRCSSVGDRGPTLRSMAARVLLKSGPSKV